MGVIIFWFYARGIEAKRRTCRHVLCWRSFLEIRIRNSKSRTFIGTSPRRTAMSALSVMLHCHGRPHTNCFTFSERELTERLQYRTRCFVQDDTDHWLRIGFWRYCCRSECHSNCQFPGPPTDRRSSSNTLCRRIIPPFIKHKYKLTMYKSRQVSGEFHNF